MVTMMKWRAMPPGFGVVGNPAPQQHPAMVFFDSSPDHFISQFLARSISVKTR
jgi:hypothetical protein